MRILLLEDNKIIANGIKTGLTKLGFNVDWVIDGEQGKQAIKSAPYDAVILDLGLPTLDGIDILKYWRNQSNDTPVLILTARHELEQRLEGLQSGADDYLCKPFALAELAARLQALIRRRYGQLSTLLQHGKLSYCPSSRIAKLDDIQIIFSAKELALLELFLLNPERVFSRPLLEEKLYSWDEEVSSNAVEVHIHHLRKKLGNKFIRTIHGLGYILGEAN